MSWVLSLLMSIFSHFFHTLILPPTFFGFPQKYAFWGALMFSEGWGDTGSPGRPLCAETFMGQKRVWNIVSFNYVLYAMMSAYRENVLYSEK